MRRAAALALLCAASCAAPPARSSASAENVLFVTIDGFRWQEVFEGAEEALLVKSNGADGAELRKAFWRDTPEARREALLPFMWGVMAKEGQIFGNGKKNCAMRVTNGHSFSYPGYAEMLCGFADPRVDSNKKIPNPNVTVFEWLNGRSGFQGSVAAYCTWDVFPSILNRERSGLVVHFGPPYGDARLDALYGDLPALWHDCTVDALEFHAGMDYLKAKKPRVFYFAFGVSRSFLLALTFFMAAFQPLRAERNPMGPALDQCQEPGAADPISPGAAEHAAERRGDDDADQG